MRIDTLFVGAVLILGFAAACTKQPDEPQREPSDPLVRYATSAYIERIGYVSDIEVNGTRCIVVRNDAVAVSCNWLDQEVEP